jgi:hypothetical protein
MAMRCIRILAPPAAASLLVALLAACSTAPSEPEAPAAGDVAGAWQLTVESPMGTRENEAVFVQNGQQLSGVIKGQRGETPLTGSITGEDIKFGINVTIQGQNLNIDYSGKVTGDTMGGTVVFGEFGDGKWSGKRKTP